MMNSSRNYEVKIYTEYGDYENPNNKDFIEYQRAFNGTKLIFLRKEREDILLGISGILLKKDLSQWNSFLFYSIKIESFSFINFINSLKKKLNELSLTIGDGDYNNLLFTKNRINGISGINDSIMGDLNEIFLNIQNSDKSDFTPSFNIPVEYAIDILEKSIKSFNFIVLSFYDKQLDNLKLDNLSCDILYYCKNINKISHSVFYSSFLGKNEKQELNRLILKIENSMGIDHLNIILRNKKIEYLMDITNKIKSGQDFDMIDLRKKIVFDKTNETYKNQIIKLLNEFQMKYNTQKMGIFYTTTIEELNLFQVNISRFNINTNSILIQIQDNINYILTKNYNIIYDNDNTDINKKSFKSKLSKLFIIIIFIVIFIVIFIIAFIFFPQYFSKI